MALRIYNTLSKRKEEFKPTVPGRVGMYVCGITAYDTCHVGHARAAVVFDVIYRYLGYKGYDVVYVRNFTDIDDKIINKAKSEGISAKEVAERYIEEYRRDVELLRCRKPSCEPKVTDHMADIIEMIVILLEKGFAYRAGADIVFAVDKFPDYGKLSGRKIEELIAGHRVEIGENKLNPMDFVLWKGAKEGEPFWDSPWGPGRPGWHIECSAMSSKYLGKSFDIHGGGKDLIFPHHENEIAQSESANGCRFVNYWIHNGFVNINSEKMSKSIGNYYTIKEVLRNYHSEALRLFLMSKHYRSPLDFSLKLMDESAKNIDYFYTTLLRMEEFFEAWGKKATARYAEEPPDEKLRSCLNGFEAKFQEAMEDDFNTARAVAHMFEAAREMNSFLNEVGYEGNGGAAKALSKARQEFLAMGSVLGILGEDPREYFRSGLHPQRLLLDESGSGQIEELEALRRWVEQELKSRDEARKKKNYLLADEIRARLMERGVAVEDTPKGTVWKLVKRKKET